MDEFELIELFEPFRQRFGIPDWVKTKEEFDEYTKKREYIRTHELNYSKEVSSMILLSLKFEDAKKVLEGKEIKELNYFNDLVKPFICLFFEL